MCQVLGVSRSGYYEWKSREQSEQKKRRAALTQKVRFAFFQSDENYGSPKITRMLWAGGERVSEKTVTRIMKAQGLRSKTVKKHKATTNSKHRLPIYPNLLNQQFQVDHPKQVWVADITYIWTREGWVYLATVMDLFSRRIIGWHMSHRMTKELVITALNRALAAVPPNPGIVHHSDRGSRYASKEYQAILRANGMYTSMSRKGNCYDNACIESFHGLIKRELIFQRSYETREEAKQEIFEYLVHFYNAKRIHSACDYMSPLEFERQYYREQGGPYLSI
ncbi:IS3 family transposase [Bacillus sp. FJAT-42376]|nr:IS3 family transposase [Bacillus sp. FJAT-42376]